MTKTILVPLDGSEFAATALAPAAALAKRLDARVVLMTSRLGGITEEPERSLSDLAANAGITNFDTMVVTDREAREGIVRLAGELEDPLVCMTTHGRSGLGVAFLGSVASDVVRALSTPLLLIGPAVKASVATRFDSVVVSSDGSAAADAIVPVIAPWIDRLALTPWFVQVVDPEARRRWQPGADVFEESSVHEMATKLGRNNQAANWEVLHDDDAAKSIVHFATAQNISLIALGTHGRSGITESALGRVAASVVRHAPCPVLLIRSSARSEA